MIGQKIGHYTILEEIGSGGMGVVYCARDEKLHRKVAIKVLAGDVTSQADMRQRVLAEARAAAALNHPGIITIYEVAEYDSHVLLVMELVFGVNVRDHAAGAPLESRAVARLGVQLADALAAAHERGVVHGDLKPENILILSDGRLKLLDFGIARRSAAVGSMAVDTQSMDAWTPQATAGTLAYMSPEQLRGHPIDGRSDLFSLGSVLYEAALGRRPFQGPNATAIVAQILQESPLPPDPQRTPHELARILRKLLQKHPEDRYQSARDLYLDLNSLVHDLELGPALPQSLKGKKSVAVLPFKLLTPNAEDAYLGVALADAIINQLSSNEDLLVRPTSTVMRYDKQSADPMTVSRELGVQIVIEGSLQKLGQRLRVHVQGWNATDASTLISAKEDADVADLFALQDRLGDLLFRALGVKQRTGEMERAAPPTTNAVAYELFLRSAERLSRLNKWDTRTAIEMLDNAVKLDPKFADAWARLAEARVLMAVTFEPDSRWLKLAEQAIRRALQLDPANAEAQCARGRVLWTPGKNFRNRMALQALQTALRINPGCHAARVWECLIFLHVGLLEEAREGLLTALATHPDDAFVLVFVGQTASYRFDHNTAAEYQARALAVDPTNIWANVFFPTVMLYAGELTGAEEKIKVARQVLPTDPWLTACEALLWAKRGKMKAAEQMLRKVLRGGEPLLHTHHMWHTMAAVYALLGKPATAITWLEKAAAFGLPNYTAFRDDPHFATLQGHPDYEKLLARLKREWEGYAKDFGNPTLLAARMSS